jgi:MFS family permease
MSTSQDTQSGQQPLFRTGTATVRSLYITALLCGSYAVAFIDRALVGVAGAPIKHDLGLSDTQFGLLHGMAFVALYCLCGIPLGWLADRADRRRMIAAGLLFWTVMTALCGLSGSFAMFVVARVGVGLGEACLVPAGMSLLASVVAKDKMARAVAIFLMGAALGNALALLGGGYLLNRLGAVGAMTLPLIGEIAPWQALFLLACPPGVILAALMLGLREPARIAAADTPPQKPAHDIKAALAHISAHRQAYGFLTAATACNIVLAQAQAAWMPLFYVRHFGLTPGDSAIAIGLMFVLSAPLGQWTGGVLIDRLQARGVSAPSNIVQAGCALLAMPAAAAFCLSDRLLPSQAAYVVFNFLVFAATPAGLTGWQLLTPARYSGMTTALLVSVVTLIGVGLGPAAVGWLTDHVFRDEMLLRQSLLSVIVAAGATGSLLGLAGIPGYARATRARHDDAGRRLPRSRAWRIVGGK